MEARLQELQAALNKKASFEAAARALAALLREQGELSDAEAAVRVVPRWLTRWLTLLHPKKAVEAACRRVLTLLQARYSERGFWLAGREAFAAAHARLGPRCATAAAALRRCAEELDEANDAAPAPPARRAGALFEGQLGLSGGADAAADAAARLPPELAALLGGDDGGFVGLEEALAASLQAPQRSGPPPAARSAVAALRTETLSAERLAQLGPGVQCSVCRCELAVDDAVQLMPCSEAHAFHAPCLAPWLAEHNSCPICRHELPTDDWRYNERKERAAADAEDAKGAANALRGGEFIWL